MKESKVKYTKDRVQITMDIQRYESMCKYFNAFNEAMNEVGELMDFRLSELRDMDFLRFNMIASLGFEKINKSYYSDYRIPTKGGK